MKPWQVYESNLEFVSACGGGIRGVPPMRHKEWKEPAPLRRVLCSRVEDAYPLPSISNTLTVDLFGEYMPQRTIKYEPSAHLLHGIAGGMLEDDLRTLMTYFLTSEWLFRSARRPSPRSFLQGSRPSQMHVSKGDPDPTSTVWRKFRLVGCPS